MRAMAIAVLRTAGGATDVMVYPEETHVYFDDHCVRYRNSPEMIEAMDDFLLGGKLPDGPFKLLPY